MTGPATASGPAVTYLVASASGDIPFDPALRETPLDGCPLCTTYGEYFAGLRDFVLGPGLPVLARELSRQAEKPVPQADIRAIILRAQKHGALYHPASVEVTCPAGTVTLGVNVATSPHGWAAMAREREALDRLSRDVPQAGLPRPLCFFEGDRLDFLMVDWFSGFHEFHAEKDGRVVLWNYEGGGLVPLDVPTAREMYRRAARILAMCYDPHTGSRIWPWRHAAGDFVASLAGGRVHARLITARGYAPPSDVAQGGPEARTWAYLHFFLTTTLSMRLDRAGGVGESVFLPPWCLEAVVSGILETFAGRQAVRDNLPGISDVVRGLSPEAWRAVLTADPEFFADPDAAFLLTRLDGHLADLAAVLRGHARH